MTIIEAKQKSKPMTDNQSFAQSEQHAWKQPSKAQK